MNTDSLKTLWELAFGDSREFIDLFFGTAYAPERCRAIFQEGQAVAALYWLDCVYEGQKFAYIYAVATHPDYRGRGLCRKLMEQTHALLAKQQYAGALLMPAETGLRQMYAGMGYRECTTLSQLDCTAGEAVEVRAVGQEEYARLRRRYLPKGGVIQEKENLAYLQTYGALYAGKDFVLAAVHEKERLFGVELLGNAEAAPGILKAMGYEAGTFRVPGDGIRFGMGIVLNENVRLPSYLGIAFD